MLKLQALVKEALLSTGEQLTFNIKNLQHRPTKTGKVAFRATTDQGKVVTFFDSTMDQVIEEVNEARGEYAVIAGTVLAIADANGDHGLIPKGTQSKGIWS